jgi:uncharacterized membrane protein YfcA
MFIYLIEILIGMIAGGFLGITGIPPLGVLLILLDYLKIGNYKSNLGTILFINLFPITIGAVYHFWQAKKINYNMGLFLLTGIIIGSFISSHFVVKKENPLSIKTLKFISAFLGLIISIAFFYSAYYEKN